MRVFVLRQTQPEQWIMKEGICERAQTKFNNSATHLVQGTEPLGIDERTSHFGGCVCVCVCVGGGGGGGGVGGGGERRNTNTK